MTSFHPRLMTSSPQQGLLSGATSELIYPDKAGAYAPALSQNARVLKRLLGHRGESIRHFFFAPNPRTSHIGRWVSRVRPGVRTVQTIMSVPKTFEGASSLIFTDEVITLSKYTQRKLQEQGVSNTHLIYPGVDMSAPERAPERAQQQALRAELGLPQDRMVFTFAGDYEFSDASHVVASAVERLFATTGPNEPQACVVFACRIKQPQSKHIEMSIRLRLKHLIAPHRLIFLNEVERILDLLAATDVMLLPANSTYAKMDIPLVLVEAMREKKPVIVADAGPLPELIEGADVGQLVPAGQGEALAEAMRRYLKDPAMVRAQGARARALATSRFDSRAMAPAYEALYERLLQT